MKFSFGRDTSLTVKIHDIYGCHFGISEGLGAIFGGDILAGIFGGGAAAADAGAAVAGAGDLASLVGTGTGLAGGTTGLEGTLLASGAPSIAGGALATGTGLGVAGTVGQDLLAIPWGAGGYRRGGAGSSLIRRHCFWR